MTVETIQISHLMMVVKLNIANIRIKYKHNPEEKAKQTEIIYELLKGIFPTNLLEQLWEEMLVGLPK